MGRSADYTIQGFLYQFDLALSELLSANDDAELTIEGIVEDIEVCDFSGTRAIQCKYHESAQNFALSKLYDPLLQMMKHFKSNPTPNITYSLFAHFPNNPVVSISTVELNKALCSKDKSLQQLIIDATGVDVEEFLKVFIFELKPKHEDLVARNCSDLEALGYSKAEVESLFYPNAIQMIADLSVKHDVADRKTSRKLVLAELRRRRSTAITQWTLALSVRDKVLPARRKQMKSNLGANVRLRHLAIFPERIPRFTEEIVLFIKSFLEKYHHKTCHIRTPLFALDVDQGDFDSIAERLVEKKIAINDGRPIKKFSSTSFFREPMTVRSRKEFSLRLIRWADYINLQFPVKADDLFVIGYGPEIEIDLLDINVEILQSEDFKEIKYMVGISDAY